MLRLRRARLRDRIGLIVLLHLLMLVGVVAAFALGLDSRQTRPYHRLPDPTKVALIVTAFEHSPLANYPDLIRAFSDSSQRVRLLDTLPNASPVGGTPDTVARYRDALGGRPFRIEVFGGEGPMSLDAVPGISPDPIRVSVQLPDGRALGVEQLVIAPIVNILNNAMLVLAVVAVIDLVIILWLAAQTTQPVERLERAVREDRLDELKPGGPREIVALAEAFLQLRRQLRDLLQERTRMLAAIAHDYRTYLTRLELRSEFIEDDEQRALAVRDVEEMRELLADTLTFARESVATDMDMVVCDVGAELTRIAAERAGRGEDVTIAQPSAPVFAVVSRVSFQRMLANLLDNAMRYGGGRAHVRVRADQDRVQILVEDEGAGVPAESLERMLEPFERLEPSRARSTGGVGLGLSIVQALAHRYQGELTLENRKEGGFRATLDLRAAEAGAPPR